MFPPRHLGGRLPANRPVSVARKADRDHHGRGVRRRDAEPLVDLGLVEGVERGEAGAQAEPAASEQDVLYRREDRIVARLVLAAGPALAVALDTAKQQYGSLGEMVREMNGRAHQPRAISGGRGVDLRPAPAVCRMKRAGIALLDEALGLV